MEGVVGVAILICFDPGLLQDGGEGGIVLALRCECYLQDFGVSCSSCGDGKEVTGQVREYDISEECLRTLTGNGSGRDCSEIWTYDCGCAAADG